MTDRNPRKRRGGSIRGEAASEPLGLGAAEAAAADAGDAAKQGTPGTPPDDAVSDATQPVEATMPDLGDAEAADAAAGATFDGDTNLDADAAAASAGALALIDPHGDPTDVIRDVPEMSVEDVERRIGARTRERRRRVAAATPATQRVAANRRAILWRDSATILIFVVLALLLTRFLLPSNAGTASASGSATESPIDIGSLPVATGIQFSAAPTIGGVVPSGLHINATPTPIPVITLPPPTPTPAPTPTVKPGTTPKPSVKPSTVPSQPPPTPTPPTASFTYTCDSGTRLATFTSTSTGGGTLASDYAWTFDDGSGDIGMTTTHTYTAVMPSGGWQVTLTVTGPGGSTPTIQSVVC